MPNFLPNRYGKPLPYETLFLYDVQPKSQQGFDKRKTFKTLTAKRAERDLKTVQGS